MSILTRKAGSAVDEDQVIPQGPQSSARRRLQVPTIRRRQGGSSEQGQGSTSSTTWTTQTSGLASRATTAAMWAVLAAGPIGLVVGGLALASSGGSTAPPAQTVAADNTREMAAAAFAQDYVLTWISTPRSDIERLDRFLGADVISRNALPETAWQAREAVATNVLEGDDGSWSVIVAISVDEPVAEEATQSGAGAAAQDVTTVRERRYFQVALTEDPDGALLASTLPAPVAAPEAAQAPVLAYDEPVASDTALAVASGDFLTGYLVDGDVTRIVSPEADITAVLPAPYAAVAVDQVRATDSEVLDEEAPEDGDQAQVLVNATVTAPAPVTGQPSRSLGVTYALSFTARQGRWEVSAIDRTPEREQTSSPDADLDVSPGAEDTTPEPSDSPSSGTETP